MKLKPADILEISGVGGERHRVLGMLEIPITITSARFLFNFYVLPDLQHPVIVGLDFMDAHKVEIDFNKKTVYIQDKLVQTCIVHSDSGLARVHRPTQIPPQSQINVEVRVSRTQTGDEVLLEPSASLNNRNLAGAKCLVKVEKRTAVISIINPSDEMVNLPADTVIATVSAVDKADVYKFDNDTVVLDEKIAECANVNVASPETNSDVSFDLSNSDLNESQRKSLTNFLSQNKDVFSTSLKDLGKTDLYHHSVETEPGEGPVRMPFYRQAPHLKAETQKLVNEMLEDGIVEPSNSIWHSPVVLVKKKDNSYRFAVDYRKLNKITKPIAHPLPRLESVFDAIGEAKAQFFTTLDLASGFWQIPMCQSTKHRAAFITHDGVYEFNRMPFGLKNAPMSFQMLMSQVLRPLNWKHVLCYIDDILIFSSNFDEHMKHLGQVFQKLRDAKLTLKPEKCYFAVSKVKYLGHILSKEGIEVDSSKADALRTFPIPKTQRDIRSYLGLCNYYRRFVQNFSKIATPLNRLLQKDTKFEWTEQCQNAFETLKNALITSVMLSYPDMNSRFILTTDASDVALGYILSQKGSDKKEKVVAFGGRSLRPDERKWTVTEKECLAVVDGIKAYREYLSHQPFTVYTDHKALQWLNNMKDPSSRLGRWALRLQEYQYEIVHKKGKNNQNADALSRRTYDDQQNASVAIASEQAPSAQSVRYVDKDNCTNVEHYTEQTENEEDEPVLIEVSLEYGTSPVVSEAVAKPDISGNTQEMAGEALAALQGEAERSLGTPQHDNNELIKLQKESKDFRHLYKFLNERDLPNDEKLANNTVYEASQYGLSDGVLFHQYQPRTKNLKPTERLIMQVAAPEVLRPDILKSYHDSLAGGGHLGVNRTFQAIQLKFYWPKMFQNVKDYVTSCDMCQKVKVNRRQQSIPLTNMPIAEPFERWHIDFVGPLPRSKDGYQHILVLVDSFTRWPEIFPVKTQEAKEVANILFREIFARYGAPRTLVSDRGRNFMSKLVSALCEMFDVTRHHSSAYHPQTNSTCERLHSTLAQTIRAYIDKDQQNWPTILPAALMAFRMSPATESTGLSPFHLVFGKEMNLPIDTSLIPKTTLGLDAQQYFEQLLDKLKIAKEIGGTNMKIAQEKSKLRHDKSAKEPGFQVGDLVLLKSMKVPKGLSPKFWPKHLGPYYITDLGPNFTYRLRNCTDHAEVKCLINASRLKRYIDPATARKEPVQETDGPQKDPEAKNEVQEPQHQDGQKKPSEKATNATDVKKEPNTSNAKCNQDAEQENSKILREKQIEGTKHYLVRRRDTWEPAQRCSQEHVRKFHIDRTKPKRKPHTQNRYFLRSSVQQNK